MAESLARDAVLFLLVAVVTTGVAAPFIGFAVRQEFRKEEAPPAAEAGRGALGSSAVARAIPSPSGPSRAARPVPRRRRAISWVQVSSTPSGPPQPAPPRPTPPARPIR